MKSLVLICICFISLMGSPKAQSFFKCLPKTSTSGQLSPSTDPSAAHWYFRPVAIPVSYTLPGNAALAGGGVSYQHVSQDPSTQEYESDFTIALPVYFGAKLDGTQQLVKGYGLSLGFLNNLVFVGVIYDGHSISSVVSVGISLNN